MTSYVQRYLNELENRFITAGFVCSGNRQQDGYIFASKKSVPIAPTFAIWRVNGTKLNQAQLECIIDETFKASRSRFVKEHNLPKRIFVYSLCAAVIISEEDYPALIKELVLKCKSRKYMTYEVPVLVQVKPLRAEQPDAGVQVMAWHRKYPELYTGLPESFLATQEVSRLINPDVLNPPYPREPYFDNL